MVEDGLEGGDEAKMYYGTPRKSVDEIDTSLESLYVQILLHGQTKWEMAAR